jgi:hypothetical protein
MRLTCTRGDHQSPSWTSWNEPHAPLIPQSPDHKIYSTSTSAIQLRTRRLYVLPTYPGSVHPKPDPVVLPVEASRTRIASATQ